MLFRSQWQTVLATTDYRTSPQKLWRLVRSLHTHHSSEPRTHEAILSPNSSSIPSPKEQANLLVDHYASISRLPHSPSDRLVQRRLHSFRVDRDLVPQFTPLSVTDAIQRAGQSTARGPDGISYAHLRHLGPHAISALCDLFNHSIRLNVIPSIWKLASIIPLLKPGKPPTSPSSYRPISLLSNPAKILERLVLDKIAPFIPTSPSQHGFKPLHSTTSLLTSLSQSILEGLNHSKPAPRSLVAAIDISKAFDTVPRYNLISKILDTDLHPNYKKWLANFISGRQSHISYDGVTSKTRRFPNGVPQGAVLSPSLFNLFLSDLPDSLTPSVSDSSYADDLTLLAQHPVVDTAADHLQQYLHQLEAWLTSNRMSVSAAKSSITLVTPFNREYRLEPRLTLFGSPLPVRPLSQILGVTFDRGMTFRHHVAEVDARARSRLNVMKALSSTAFGHSKESLTALYKQFIRPVLSYVSPAWAADLAPSHMQVLQRTQNAALRIATGCVRSTPVTHLHAETKVLPIKDHLDMRGTQTIASSACPGHPLRHFHLPRAPGRPIHRTPASYYGSLRARIPPVPPGRTEKSWIHEFFVARSLSEPALNSLLNEVPPPISPDEIGRAHV